MVLGLLTSRFHHEREYYTEIAKLACFHHITVAQFTPFSIDPKTEFVNGLLFDANQQDWVEQQFVIPSHIYNRCTYKNEKNFKRALPIIKWLQSRPQSLFLNDELPNETDMYEILAKNKKLVPYVPLIKHASEKTTLQLLQMKKGVVIKPLHSLSKQNMYHISYQNSMFHVTTLERNHFLKKTFQTRDTFLSWLQSLLQTCEYTVQPMAQTSPVHIRSLLQKNKEGIWEEQEKLVQIDDTPYSFLFPLTDQTHFIPFTKWQHQLSKIDLILLQDSLHIIMKETSQALEDATSHLFELELSIIMDVNGAVWLYQVDTNPTYTTFIQHNIDLAEKVYTAPLHYYRYIKRSTSSKLEM
ncbi:YheC/YheD family protein [Bacillus cereus group sp. BfR-BA-01380]|uniref:YheC/YheD family protein n=1 Tax=Bacillus cereus group sp. BfR-BA-01380 TaxID=2920324 RepID=UPI001F590DE9|nr:YheC/YheD family protein [Bacillus cereus group sp. BfR-BA-01380]